MGSKHSGDFEYRGWLVRLEITGSGEVITGRADLHYDGHYKCRMALASPHHGVASARAALEAKAKDFIDEWASRSHAGESGFQDL